MANQTISFTEVWRFKPEELRRLQERNFVEICREVDKVFSVTVKKAEAFKEMYKEIVPALQRIKTADGIEVYVARCKRHLICSEPIIYRSMKSDGAVDECYKDVTGEAGSKFTNLSYINWAVDWAKMGEFPQKETTFTLPNVRQGARMFYCAS